MLTLLTLLGTLVRCASRVGQALFQDAIQTSIPLGSQFQDERLTHLQSSKELLLNELSHSSWLIVDLELIAKTLYITEKSGQIKFVRVNGSTKTLL